MEYYVVGRISFGSLLSLSSFLEDIDRIAVKDYQATDDDIMRARLRCSGVKEYRMIFENGNLLYLLSS